MTALVQRPKSVDITLHADRAYEPSLLHLIEEKGFRDLSPFEGKQGAQKECFIGYDNLGRKVFLTFDKTPNSGLSQTSAKKGLDSRNERDVASKLPIDDALTHKINPLLYSFEIDGKTVNVWPYYENSMTLRDWLKDRGSLNEQDFKSLALDTATAERYFVERGHLHRDPNRGNILLRRNEKGNLESRMVDMAMSAPTESESVSPLTTGPARSIRDPTIDGIFTSNHNRRYDESSEVYAWANNMITSVLGYSPVKYDFINGEAKAEIKPVFTIEKILRYSDAGPITRKIIDWTRRVNGTAKERKFNLLNEDGTLNPKKHVEAFEESFKEFPEWAKDYVPLLRKAVSLEWKARPSFAEIERKIEKMSRPSLLGHAYDRVKESIEYVKDLGSLAKVGIAIGAVGIAVLGGLAGKTLYQKIQSQRQAEIEGIVEQSQKHVVTTKLNPVTLEIESSTVKLKARNDNTIGKIISHTDVIEINSDQSSRTIYLEADERPFRKIHSKGTCYSLRARAYIEGRDEKDGMPIQEFILDPQPEDDKYSYTDLGSSLTINLSEKKPTKTTFWKYREGTINLPEDLPDGLYVIATEIMSPPKEEIEIEEKSHHRSITFHTADVKYEGFDNAIARKRILLNVNRHTNNTPRIDIGRCEIEREGIGDYRIEMRDISQPIGFLGNYGWDNKRGLNPNIVIFNENEEYKPGWRNEFLGLSYHTEKPEKRLAIASTVYDGKVIQFSGIPFRSVQYTPGSNYHYWEPGTPDKNFPHKLAESRRKLEAKLGKK